MEKQIILLLLMSFYVSAICQQRVQTSGSCTDAMAQNTKGRWIKSPYKSTAVTQSQKQETYNRLEVIDHILLQMYPQPVGVDVRLSRGVSKSYFGATGKYTVAADDRLSYEYSKMLPLASFYYSANFSPHYCQHTEKGIVFMPGEKNENSDGINIKLNDLAGAVEATAGDDDWTINGLPVMMRIPVMNEKWKGYELLGDARGMGRHVIIHRNGMLPYIPVTRKQYLDRCIAFTEKLFDKMINLARQTLVRSLEVQEAEKKERLDKFQKQFANDSKKLKANVDYYLSGYKTDQQLIDEKVANANRNKEAELKKFADEMSTTNSEGLLDSAALILVRYHTTPSVFETDAGKGFMLVTENPDYIRKELPHYIPQFIVLSWKWNPEFYPVHDRYEKLLLQDFPIEKLQAMIDK